MLLKWSEFEELDRPPFGIDIIVERKNRRGAKPKHNIAENSCAIHVQGVQKKERHFKHTYKI